MKLNTDNLSPIRTTELICSPFDTETIDKSVDTLRIIEYGAENYVAIYCLNTDGEECTVFVNKHILKSTVNNIL